MVLKGDRKKKSSRFRKSKNSIVINSMSPSGAVPLKSKCQPSLVFVGNYNILFK